MISPITIQSTEELEERIRTLEERSEQNQETHESAEIPLAEENIELKKSNLELQALAASLEEQIRQFEAQSIQLHAARDTAIKANKVKSSFLAMMSHELRTPLNGVIGMASLLQETSLTEEQTEYLTILQSSSRSLLSMITDVLDYATIESGELVLDAHTFNFHQLIAEILESFSEVAHEKNLELIYFLDYKVPRHIRADSTRIRQILANLMSNAIKFTEQGEIMLLMSGIEMDDHSIMLIGEVDDTGIGISEEHVKRLFKDFQQADVSYTRKYGGAGLGLTLAKQITEHMGGSITVNSQVGKGSRFMFSFIVEADREEEDLIEISSLQGKEITLIIDNDKNRYVVETLAKRWHMNPVVCASVRDAFIYLKNKNNPCDLVVVDVDDQLFNSADLGRPLRVMRPQIPLLLLRGIRVKDEPENLSYFDARLNKPVNPDRLLHTFISLLAPTYDASQ